MEKKIFYLIDLNWIAFFYHKENSNPCGAYIPNGWIVQTMKTGLDTYVSISRGQCYIKLSLMVSLPFSSFSERMDISSSILFSFSSLFESGYR